MEEKLHLGLSDLLDQDLSSYEFFNTLSPAVQEKIREGDPGSFSELQHLAKNVRHMDF